MAILASFSRDQWAGWSAAERTAEIERRTGFPAGGNYDVVLDANGQFIVVSPKGLRPSEYATAPAAPLPGAETTTTQPAFAAEDEQPSTTTTPNTSTAGGGFLIDPAEITGAGGTTGGTAQQSSNDAITGRILDDIQAGRLSSSGPDIFQRIAADFGITPAEASRYYASVLFDLMQARGIQIGNVTPTGDTGQPPGDPKAQPVPTGPLDQGDVLEGRSEFAPGLPAGPLTAAQITQQVGGEFFPELLQGGALQGRSLDFLENRFSRFSDIFPILASQAAFGGQAVDRLGGFRDFLTGPPTSQNLAEILSQAIGQFPTGGTVDTDPTGRSQIFVEGFRSPSQAQNPFSEFQKAFSAINAPAVQQFAPFQRAGLAQSLLNRQRNVFNARALDDPLKLESIFRGADFGPFLGR